MFLETWMVVATLFAVVCAFGAGMWYGEVRLGGQLTNAAIGSEIGDKVEFAFIYSVAKDCDGVIINSEGVRAIYELHRSLERAQRAKDD